MFRHERENPVSGKLYYMSIIITPDGSAPENIREAWIGLDFIAEAKGPGNPEFDPLSTVQVSLEPRFGFVVPYDVGISTLFVSGKKEAVDWYTSNWPEGEDFVFGKDEVVYTPW